MWPDHKCLHCFKAKSMSKGTCLRVKQFNSNKNVPKQAGFTLVEMLIGLFILGAIMVSFFAIVGNTLDSSRSLSARNDIIQDAQVAQQLINARIQEACYVYTSGTVQMAASGYTTKRSALSASNWTWTVGVDPIIAMILPPNPSEPTPGGLAQNQRYRFFAYYPVQRQDYINNAASSLDPELSPANGSGWMMMQYFKFLDTRGTTVNAIPVTTGMDPSLTCTQNVTAGNATITGGASDLLVDFVQPANIAPTYTMFSFGAGTLPTVTFRLRMLRLTQTQNQGGTSSSGQIRFPPTTTDPMAVSVAPQNWCAGNAVGTACP